MLLPLLVLLRSAASRRHLPLPHVHAAVVAAGDDVGAIRAEPAHQQAGAAATGAALAGRICTLLLFLLLLCRSVAGEPCIPLPPSRLLNCRLTEVPLLPGTTALPGAALLRLAARGPLGCRPRCAC